MARRVFFSFHYERDIWRANVVRNSWVTQDREAAGFWDASLWEEAKKKGDAAIKQMIDDALRNTSVTAVLIGTETASRPYVKYELIQSYNKTPRNGMLGVYIHGIKDINGRTDPKGPNPFDQLYVERNGQKVFLSSLYRTYDWVLNDGYTNFGAWVEQAAKDAGR
jgi:hypothetical protein